MEEKTIYSGLTFRTDLIGDLGRSNKIQGFKAEALLKRIIVEHRHNLKRYLYKRYRLHANVYILHENYKEKYKKYLKDKEARKYILEKYADKISIVDILCGRITDLCAKDCIELLEYYESNEDIYLLIDKIMSNYKTELKSLFVYDI